MIIFLTLCYIGILFLLIKFKVLPDILPVKLSPIAFIIALFLFLFIPLQWGAPSGPAVVLRNSVQIVSNVRGRVIEVPVVANTPLIKGDVLFRIDPTQYQAKVDQIGAQLQLAKMRLEQFTQLQRKDAGSKFRVEEAKANLDSLTAQMADANWQLQSTTIKAPADGFVTAVGLRPGARVGTVPLAAAMPFIDTSKTIIAAQIPQIYIRYIKPGQKADITFKVRPGEVSTAKVIAVLPAISAGQVAVSGSAATPNDLSAGPFIVTLELDDPVVANGLPAGAYGQVAVYTTSAQAAHAIRKIMMRMQAWMNYLIPT